MLDDCFFKTLVFMQRDLLIALRRIFHFLNVVIRFVSKPEQQFSSDYSSFIS